MIRTREMIRAEKGARTEMDWGVGKSFRVPSLCRVWRRVVVMVVDDGLVLALHGLVGLGRGDRSYGDVI